MNNSEFQKLSTEQIVKIQDEIAFMHIFLDILGKLLGHAKNEKPVLAWPVDPDDFGYDALFRFSCIKVAATALSANPSKIVQVCKKAEHRNSTAGWYFCYEEDYDSAKYSREPENLNFMTNTKNNTDEFIHE